MSKPARVVERTQRVLGLVALAATFILLSPGVRLVHAEDTEPRAVSIDPVLEARLAASPGVPAAPPLVHAPSLPTTASDAEPGTPGVEVRPGVIVLNTRGFNYGPPPGALDEAALAVEGEIQDQ